MGLFGSTSKSRTTNVSTTQQADTRAMVEGQGVAATGEGSTVNITNPEPVDILDSVLGHWAAVEEHRAALETERAGTVQDVVTQTTAAAMRAATGQAGDTQQYVTIAALAAVALVAAAAMWR